jgi:NAD(P)-dependent dehydrogenase (short-subunit alcohol dehydrogenase family)
LRDHLSEIRRRGAELVIIGNGAQHFARAFREDQELDCPVLVDPDLAAYQAAGLRRGRLEMLSPLVPLNGLRALVGGYRVGMVQGDPWQLGGVFVVRPDGSLAFEHVSRQAGDHPSPAAILTALEPLAAPVRQNGRRSAAVSLVAQGVGLALDPIASLSFDRTGYLIHSLRFDPTDLAVDLEGRRCLVTGASSGLGFETALALADFGAEVILVCRSRRRGEATLDRIRTRTGNPRLHLHVADMASLDSVRACGVQFEDGALDVLVHNAGFMPTERAESPEGLELAFATHVVGPHVLTKLLRPALERAAQGRVIWVSSGGMYSRRLEIRDYSWLDRRFDGLAAYAETKRAQVVLAERWAKAFAATRVTVNSMHPGWADTAGVRESLPRFWRVMRPLLRTPEEGADTIVWLAASRAASKHSGEFFFDRHPRTTHLLPWTRESSEDADALWKICERFA